MVSFKIKVNVSTGDGYEDRILSFSTKEDADKALVYLKAMSIKGYDLHCYERVDEEAYEFLKDKISDRVSVWAITAFYREEIIVTKFEV